MGGNVALDISAEIGVTWTQCAMCGAQYCGEACMTLHNHMQICPWNQTASPPDPKGTPTKRAKVAASMLAMLGAAGDEAHLVGKPEPASPKVAHRISQGTVQRMYRDDTTPGSVVQVLHIKEISGANSYVKRSRLVVSDGQHYQQAVVVTQLNAMVLSGEVQTLGLIRLTEFNCKGVENRRVIIIFGLEVVSGSVERIGEPSNVDQAGAAAEAIGGGEQTAAAATCPAPQPPCGARLGYHCTGCKVELDASAEVGVAWAQCATCGAKYCGEPCMTLHDQMQTCTEPPAGKLRAKLAASMLAESEARGQETQLMDGWCCREFCNNAGCVSPDASCWFEWRVDLVVQFLRRCGVLGWGGGAWHLKVDYLVERWGVDPTIVAECFSVAVRQSPSGNDRPVFCHNALMDLIRRPGYGANVEGAQSMCGAAEEHVSLAHVRLHDAQNVLAGAQEALRREVQRLERFRVRAEETPWAADVHMLEGFARAEANHGGARAAKHCPEMEILESDEELASLYAHAQRAADDASMQGFEAPGEDEWDDDPPEVEWEEDPQMAGHYELCDVAASHESGGSGSG